MGSDPPDRGVAPLPRPTRTPDWRDRADEMRDRLADAVEARGLWRAVVGGVAVVLVVGAGWWLLRPAATGPPIEDSLPLLEPASLPSVVAESEPARIVVHVAGAVAQPGLVELEAGSRVATAVAAAGGGLADADLDRINLALPLSDADRVYVPQVGEVVAADPAAGVDVPTGPLDLNRATTAQLDELPGVGPATAANIVRFRDEHGDFASVAALEDVPGIGPAKLDQLRDLVTVAP